MYILEQRHLCMRTSVRKKHIRVTRQAVHHRIAFELPYQCYAYQVGNPNQFVSKTM